MNETSRRNQEAASTPNTLLGTICFICVCATVVSIVYVAVPRSEIPRRLWTPVLIETNGNETILPPSRQLEFWTPSARTRDYLHKENGQVVPSEMWEVISNDEAVEQFGMLLHSSSSVIGYRRVEVWGQGKTSFKPGWWWTLNVFTNYTADDLSHAYESYWQSHQILFVEVIDNRGDEGK
jgi:hypothetical protein